MLAVIAGKRPLRPRQLLQDNLWSLVTTCLRTSPSQRPNAGQISKVLASQIELCQETIEEGNITTYVLLSLERIRLLIPLPLPAHPGIMMMMKHRRAPGTFLIHAYPLLGCLMST